VPRVPEVLPSATPRRGNGITEIMQNSVSGLLTKPGGRIAYSLISDVKSEITPKEIADSESAAQTATNLQHEAQIYVFLDVTSHAQGMPRRRISPYLCYCVTGASPTIRFHLCHQCHPAHACHAWVGQEPPGVALPRMRMG
jgi:hypothetical protein